MIYFTWSTTPTAGNEGKAAEWLLKLAKHANEAYGKYGHVEITRNLDGVTRLHWLGKYTSLAAFDEARAKWGADRKVQDLVREGGGFYEPPEQHYFDIVEQ